MRYQTFFHRIEKRVSPGWMPEDDPIITTERVRLRGVVIHADNHKKACHLGKFLYGSDFSGAQALDVDCQFCHDGNEAVTDAFTNNPAPCPRCGTVSEAIPRG